MSQKKPLLIERVKINMPSPSKKSIIFKGYQLSSHKNLGLYTGIEEDIITFCSIKFNVEADDIALERLRVRTITKTEVLFFKEVIGQIKKYSKEKNVPEDLSAGDEIREDLEFALQVLSPFE